jgi:hypothetical protein
MSAVSLELLKARSYRIDRIGHQCRRRRVKPRPPLHPVSNPTLILIPLRRSLRHPSPERLETPMSVALPSTTMWRRPTLNHLNRHLLKHNRNGSSNRPRRTEPPLQHLISLRGAAPKSTPRSKRLLHLLAPSNHIHCLSTLLHKFNSSSMRHLRLSSNSTKAYARTTLLLPLQKHRYPTLTLTRIHTHTIKARTSPRLQLSSNPARGLYTHLSGRQGYTTSSRIKAIGTNRTNIPFWTLYARYEICHTLIIYAH